VAATVDMWHIKEHYYRSQKEVNPSQVVPVGPVVDFSEPHGRRQAGSNIR
jgi:putative glutathione S-transferase